MVRAKLVRSLAAAVMLAGCATTASADHVEISQGYIQVSALATDFLIQSSTGIGFAGEKEGTPIPPAWLSGMSGQLVNLSSTYADVLSNFSVYAPDRDDMPARANFTFTAGNGTIPPLADVLANPNAAFAFAPFTFEGLLVTFASFDDATANVNPVGQFHLGGAGTARALFRVQTTPIGEQLPNLPLENYSIIYQFGGDTEPVPEPGTLLLLGGGLAAVAARARQRRKAQPL